MIGKRYWNNGLGSFLLEEAIEWAQASGILRRLQLTVQTRNQAAVHLYQKYGFVIEGRPRAWGVYRRREIYRCLLDG